MTDNFHARLIAKIKDAMAHPEKASTQACRGRLFAQVSYVANVDTLFILLHNKRHKLTVGDKSLVIHAASVLGWQNPQMTDTRDTDYQWIRTWTRGNDDR